MSEESEDDFLDDLVGPGIYEAATPTPRSFKAWHKPRKQYVREVQWCSSIKQMLPSWELDNGPIRYLTLPGQDLLDIRLIHESVCQATDSGIHFIGFDKAAAPADTNQTNLNISLHDIYHLDRVDRNSRIFPDDIMLAGDPNSIAYREVSLGGPYHAINLDFCGGFAQRPVNPNQLPTIYDLLSVLFEIQSRSHFSSLLFMTVRTDRASGDRESIEKLFEIALNRFHECEPYRNAVGRHFQITDDDSFRSALTDATSYEGLFLLSMFTYLVDLAMVNHTQLVLENVANYTVFQGGSHPDMASIVFKIEPIRNTTPDPHGLGNERFLAVPPNACNLSRALVYPTATRVNIDQKLEQDNELLESLIHSTEKLLTQARYSVEDYRVWLTAQTQRQ